MNSTARWESTMQAEDSDSRHCVFCDSSLAGQRRDAKHCSGACRAEASRLRAILDGTRRTPYRSLAQRMTKADRQSRLRAMLMASVVQPWRSLSDALSKAHTRAQRLPGSTASSPGRDESRCSLPSPAKFAIGLDDGEHCLTEGLVDKEACWAFTHGYCAELALAIHNHTGWPIVSAGHWDDDNTFAPGAHFGVFAPDGRVLDIEGLTEIIRWAGRWGVDAAFGEMSPAALRDYLPDIDEELLISRAATFVKPILAAMTDREAIRAAVGRKVTDPPAPSRTFAWETMAPGEDGSGWVPGTTATAPLADRRQGTRR